LFIVGLCRFSEVYNFPLPVQYTSTTQSEWVTVVDKRVD